MGGSRIAVGLTWTCANRPDSDNESDRRSQDNALFPVDQAKPKERRDTPPLRLPGCVEAKELVRRVTGGRSGIDCSG